MRVEVRLRNGMVLDELMWSGTEDRLIESRMRMEWLVFRDADTDRLVWVRMDDVVAMELRGA